MTLPRDGEHTVIPVQTGILKESYPCKISAYAGMTVIQNGFRSGIMKLLSFPCKRES